MFGINVVKSWLQLFVWKRRKGEASAVKDCN